MEWYTLDDSLRRNVVIEKFESFIWTERYFAWGDFQIVTKSTFDSRMLLQAGVRIGMAGSSYVMTIENVLDETGNDGVRNLTVTGRSVESWLDDRVAMPLIQDLTTTPKWIITGTPGNIIRNIFKTICVDGVLSPNDVISFYHSGTLLPPGSISEPAGTYTIEFEPDTVYNSIKKICEIWVLGFRLVKNGDEGELYFEVYTGNDRTSAQSVNAAVIFSRDMETIDKSSVLRSNSDFKNVAYVFAQNDAAIVYGQGCDPSVSGSDRRVLLVKADDLDQPAGPELDSAMNQKGFEELANHRDIYAFDGEIPQHQPFVYGIHYNLGDLVEERNSDGFANYMIVTEQIFVSDSEGERSYPTLVLSEIVTPGSWETEPPDEHWADVDINVHWIDK